MPQDALRPGAELSEEAEVKEDEVRHQNLLPWSVGNCTSCISPATTQAGPCTQKATQGKDIFLSPAPRGKEPTCSSHFILLIVSANIQHPGT